MNRRAIYALPALLAGACVLLAGCTPSYVDRSDIDRAHAMGQWKTVCRGLDMEEAGTRSHAVNRLQDVDEPIAASCVCERVVRNGAWDEAVAEGLKGSRRDDMVGCLASLLDEPGLDRPAELVTALSLTASPVARDHIFQYLSKGGAPDDARARAARAMAGSSQPERAALLVKLLGEDTAPAVRAAAAGALVGHDSDEVLGALRAAHTGDDSGDVRMAALETLRSARVEGADELTCQAILSDPDESVRASALGLYLKTKRDVAVECLRRKAFTKEESGQVREKLLEVLKSSPHKGAADILCDAIPFFLEHYVDDDIPQKIPGTLITFAQNDRDWQRSLECAQKAYAQRHRYDCYGKQHIANWVKELGGNAFAPRCPKTDGTTAIYQQAEGGQGVISFE